MTTGGFLVAPGSALILPLAVIEGPVVSVLAGFLSAQGYYHWHWAFCLLVCGDLIGDVIYYWVGRTGRAPLVALARWLRMRNVVTPEVQGGLTRNATKMLLIGKWTHSIGCLVLIGCGMLRLSITRFILVNLVATLPKSAALFSFGYFAGCTYPFFERHFVLAMIALCSVGVTATVLLLRKADGFWASGVHR